MFDLLKRLLTEVLAAIFFPTSRRSDSESPEPPWLIAARREIGFREQPGNRGIERYVTLAHAGSSGDPWCAIFINAMLESAGYPGTRSAAARSFEHSQHFVRPEGPALGCIATMWRQSKASGLGHVFFYLGENDKGLLALGGNQSDQVLVQYEPRSRITGYWWPSSYPLPKVGPVIVSDQGHTEGSEL
jgi:uncharacterized protein (TIGR02594 family)